MLRNLYIVIIFLLATNQLFGQGFKLGVFFDPTVSWLRSDVEDVKREQARVGFDFGVSADYFFSQNYAFATGISLYNTGGTLKYNNPYLLRTKDGSVQIATGGNVKYKIQYIKIPVALKFKTHMIGRYIYSVNLGFDPMLRVSARANYSNVKNVKATQATNLFNLGLHFGAGAQYSLGKDFAVFGGLTFMSTLLDMTSPAHDKITSNNLIFRIGLMF